MTRNGKIARLPHGIREEVNRRLRDNVPGPRICEWVNRLPACRKVCAEFARRGGNAKSPVTVSQLSEWRRGGFQDWLREQAVLDETRELRQWCAQLAGNGGDLTEGVATLLSAQLLKLVVAAPLAIKCGVRNGEDLCERSTKIAPADGSSCSMQAGEMEEAVRVLGGLVKCLWGIRRGDQNRVRLEQSERKLALRSKLAAIKLEKYEKEKAEQEELERKERAAERRKKNGLSDAGKIHLLRGRLFGPEGVIKEKEAELKRLQKDLKIMKEKFGMSENPSGDVSAEPAKAGTPNCAPSGCEPMRVDASTCECEPHPSSPAKAGYDATDRPSQGKCEPDRQSEPDGPSKSSA
jgi:hypothetical protein